MTCEDLLDLLHDFVGGELIVESHQTVEIHVRGCERCQIIVHSYTHTIRVARALPKCGTLPPAVEARLRAVIEPELARGETGEKPSA